MKLFLLIGCFLIVLFSGCNELDPKGEKEVRAFVKEWNEAHTQLKASYLERNYMDVVDYYGKERTKIQVQQDKNLLFEQFPDYTQRVLNNELTVTKEAGVYLVTFTKHVQYDGIEADYTSYLSVFYKNGDFKILREGVAEDSADLDAPIFPKYRENHQLITKNRRLYGDFNGDALSDYAYVLSPEVIATNSTATLVDAEVVCKGACNSVITFSNPDLKSIVVEGTYRSQLENLKDLNGDGADELGFWDIKATTKTLSVYDVATGTLLTAPILINTNVHRNLSLIDVFKKTGPNKITVTHSAQENGKWVLKSEVIVLE